MILTESFHDWIKAECKCRAMFISDNNGFDWQFINWYSHHFLGNNPFGFSSTNLGSLYKGLVTDTFVNFKHLRKTKPLIIRLTMSEAMPKRYSR